MNRGLLFEHSDCASIARLCSLAAGANGVSELTNVDIHRSPCRRSGDLARLFHLRRHPRFGNSRETMTSVASREIKPRLLNPSPRYLVSCPSAHTNADHVRLRHLLVPVTRANARTQLLVIASLKHAKWHSRPMSADLQAALFLANDSVGSYGTWYFLAHAPTCRSTGYLYMDDPGTGH